MIFLNVFSEKLFVRERIPAKTTAKCLTSAMLVYMRRSNLVFWIQLYEQSRHSQGISLVCVRKCCHFTTFINGVVRADFIFERLLAYCRYCMQIHLNSSFQLLLCWTTWNYLQPSSLPLFNLCFLMDLFAMSIHLMSGFEYLTTNWTQKGWRSFVVFHMFFQLCSHPLCSVCQLRAPAGFGDQYIINQRSVYVRMSWWRQTRQP